MISAGIPSHGSFNTPTASFLDQARQMSPDGMGQAGIGQVGAKAGRVVASTRLAEHLNN